MPTFAPPARKGGRSALSSVSAKLTTFGIAAALVVTPVFAISPAFADDAVAPFEASASSDSSAVADPSTPPATMDASADAPTSVPEPAAEAPAAEPAPEAPAPEAAPDAAARVAAPFSVDAPANGSTVGSTTPTYSGTGTTGDTITIVYSGQALLNYTAGTTVVDDNGNWSIVTDFSRLNGGDTEVRTHTVSTAPDGTEVGTFFTNITFPTAPVATTAFTVETPTQGETRNDFLNLVPFTGTGGAGNTITVVYFGANGLSTAGVGQVNSDGTYRVLTNFGQLSPGSTFAQSFVQQTTPDGTIAAREISRSFTFAVAPVPAFPFTVQTPANGSTVDSITPTYSGTGTPGNTVTIIYSGQGLQNYVAGTAVVDGAGNWMTVTDFSRLNGGDTEVRTRSTETTPAGVEVNALFTNITFPTPPVAVTPFTVTSPLEGETRNDFLNLVAYTGTGGPGNTITVVYFGANGLSTAGVGEVGADGNYRVLTNFGQLAPGATFVQSFVQQTTPAGTIAAREIARSFNFATAPVAQFPFTVTYPGTGQTVDSVTPTFLGTATPGNTVRITYSGVGLLNYTAGEAIVDQDGNFSIPTSFENLTPGETETRVAVRQLDVNGIEIDRLFRLFNFAEAPVAVALAAPVLNTPVVVGANVTFTGTGVVGATVEIAVTDPATSPANGQLLLAAPATVTTTVAADGTFSVTAAFNNGAYSASATQFSGSGANRSAPSATVAFTVAVVAAPVVPAGTTGSVNNGLAYTGLEVGGMAALAGMLLLAGAALVLVRRRRATPAGDTAAE